MVHKCPECGKGFVILYTQLWAYKGWHKEGPDYYCSWKCLQAMRGKRDIKKEPETEKGEKNMALDKHDRLDMAKQVLAAMDEGTDPIAFLRDVGYAAPAQMYQDLKKTVREVQPDLIEKFPKDLRAWRQEKKERAERQPIDDKAAEEIVRDFKQAAIPPEVETPEGEFTVKKPEVPEGVVKGPVTPDELMEKFGEKGWTKLPKVEVPEYLPKKPAMEYRVTGISTEAGDFQYFRKQGFIDWTTLDGTAVSMSLAEWATLMRVFPEMVSVLGVDL